jgi:predicted nucleic acid-binding protein
MIEDNPEWVKIRGLGLSGDDAEHVLNAMGRCGDVLLTYDNDLLNRAQEIQQHCGLRVVKPSELCAETGWSSP